MTPEDPRHGTNAGYVAGCRCDGCRQGRAKARKERGVYAHRNGGRVRVSHAQLVAVVDPWLRQGISMNAIATAAGLGQSSFMTHYSNGGEVNRATYAALRNVTEDSFSGTSKIYSHLTRTRIFSLMAMGQELKDMPVDNRGMWRYRENITIGTARLVRDYYVANEMKVGPNRQTQARTLGQGHRPPLAWDDPGTLAWPDGPPAAPAPAYGSVFVPHGDPYDEAAVIRILNGDVNVQSRKPDRDEAMRRWLAVGKKRSILEELHGWKSGRYGLAKDEAA